MMMMMTMILVHCLLKQNETKMFFCNISYKTRAILMKFDTPFPE